MTENTAFEKEQFGVAADATAEVQQYNLKTTDIRVEKRTTSFVALNDIDGITLAMHVGDSWWADEFKALFGGTAPAYQEFEGSFDKDTSTFTLTKGINFDRGYEATDLDPAISFTTTDWQDNMFKEWGLTTATNEDGTTTTTKEWYHKEIRNLGVGHTILVSGTKFRQKQWRIQPLPHAKRVFMLRPMNSSHPQISPKHCIAFANA